MSFTHGKNTVFKLDDSGGTLRDITSFLTDVDFPGMSADVAETTVFGAASKTFLAGQKSGTVSITGNWDPTVDGYLAGIVGSDGIDFEYGPEGGSAGDIKYSGKCICTAYNTKSPVGGTGTFSASFQISGDVSRGTF